MSKDIESHVKFQIAEATRAPAPEPATEPVPVQDVWDFTLNAAKRLERFREWYIREVETNPNKYPFGMMEDDWWVFFDEWDLGSGREA